MVQSNLVLAKRNYSHNLEVKMDWGKADSWDEEQIEAWEHNEWLLMQEMGDDYYKLHRRYDHDSEGDNPYKAERRI